MRRYWKCLLVWPLVVLLLVLAASLPPVLVNRSNKEQEEKDHAIAELNKAATGITNGIGTAFIPAASLGLWATGLPNFLDQIDNQPVQIATSYFDGKSPFQVAARSALDLVPTLGRDTIKSVGLAPHGSVSALFPIFNIFSTRPLGANLFNDPQRRKGNLRTIFSNGFLMEGPVNASIGRILATRFPVFFEASNCSCDASSPTSFNVILRKESRSEPFETISPSDLSLDGYTYGKLADYPEKFGVTDGRRFPTEV